VAGRGALGRAQTRVSVPPAPPLLLASTSPQRTAILHQLRIPHEIVAPDYEEDDPPDADPVELVRRHAIEKARSVAPDERPVLAVDTAVALDGRVYAKPADEEEAFEMLDALSGRTHVVVSGLCLRTVAWEFVDHAETRVTFRALTPREIGFYVASGEWEGRAGGYAIQGLGASLVDRVEGDYLNVVGLPGAVLVRLLAERFAGVYGFG
jgi:nucleoside triphosphate pyrophosphatase